MSIGKWSALFVCALFGAVSAVRAESSGYAWSLSGADEGAVRPPLSPTLAGFSQQPTDDQPAVRGLLRNVLTGGADKKFAPEIISPPDSIPTTDINTVNQARTLPTAIPEPRGFAFGGVGLILVGAFVTYRSHRQRNAGGWQSRPQF